MKTIVEICAGSLNSALAASEGGAQRIELCDNLYEGGTTPSLAYLKIARERISILLHVLIRPRGGDFCYNDVEFEMMKEDIKICKELGMDGVVIGLLLPDGSIDEKRTVELTELARPMSLTFHRAFDMTPDPMKALSVLKDIGVDRILTSGQKMSVIEGKELVKKLIAEAGDDLIILPGAGLNIDNIEDFARYTESSEYHTTCRSSVNSRMVYRNPDVTMGGLPQIPEYEIMETDPSKVALFIKKLTAI